MVSGRVVPYSPIQGISKIAQAYLGRKGIEESEAKEAGIQEEAGIKQQAARQQVIDTMFGREGQHQIPEGQAGPQVLPIEADPQKAAIQGVSDPWLQDSGMDKVALAMMKGKGGSGARPIGTSTGYYEETAEGWKPMVSAKGTPIMPYQADVENRRRVAAAKESAKLGEQIELKPELIEAEALAERKAEKIIDQPKVESSLEAGEAKKKMLDSSIDQAINQSGTWTTGFLGSATSWVPGTPAHDLGKTLDTVRANIGFDKLQEMRANSPTGGALGQVSERENTLLQSVWSSVEQSQSQAQLKENLEKVRTQVKESWNRVKSAYKKDYGKEFEGITTDGAKASEGLPEGVSQELWDVMTPEERAVF